MTLGHTPPDSVPFQVPPRCSNRRVTYSPGDKIDRPDLFCLRPTKTGTDTWIDLF